MPLLRNHLTSEGHNYLPNVPHLDVRILLMLLFWRSRKLVEWAQFFGFNFVGPPHSAIADARMTARLLREVGEQFPHLTAGSAVLWTQGYQRPLERELRPRQKSYNREEHPTRKPPPILGASRETIPPKPKQWNYAMGLGAEKHDKDGEPWTFATLSKEIDRLKKGQDE